MNADDYAILIGINPYPTLGPGGTKADLGGPENDVDALKGWLIDPAGGGLPPNGSTVFEFKAGLNGTGGLGPTSDDLESVLGKLKGIAEKNPKGRFVGRRLYLFLSGHGFSPSQRKGCLFTPNATDEQGFNIHATGWLSWLQDSGLFTEYVLLMDCCMDRQSFLPERNPQIRPLASFDPPRAGFVAFAAQRPLKAVEQAIAADGGRTHGLFTWTVLEGLRGAAADRNGRVTGRSLADWVRNAMSARMTAKDQADPDVALEPEVIQEDSKLVFVRQVARPVFGVEVSFPAPTVGATAHVWSGAPPRIVHSFTVSAAAAQLSLPPGLHLIEVPDAKLRQGFEVLEATKVVAEETGPPVKEAPPDALFDLDVDPGDPTAEIYVIDGQFELADSGRGSLATKLPFGLFKLKTRIGRAIKHSVVLLDTDRPALERARIAKQASTVVPIDNTAVSHEYHTHARFLAQTASASAAGARAALLVMARTFSPDGSAAETKPWQGITVVDEHGALVLDLEHEGERDTGGDPYAICTKAVTPGSYYLRQRLDDGTAIEQSLIVCESWRLEAYVLRRVAREPGTLSSRPRVSIMMGRLDVPPTDQYIDQLIDTARVALADERQILNDRLESLLFTKFENPMAGIIGGHLLLVERERNPARDISLLDTVVKNLEGLLGPAHPDVAALALRAPRRRSKLPRLTGPPMLQRSWKILVDGAQRRPDLVPLSMWERVHAVSALPPFLIWATDGAVKAAARKQVVEAILPGVEHAAEVELAHEILDEALVPIPPRSRGATAPRHARKVAMIDRSVRVRAAALSVPPSALQALIVEQP